MAASDTSRSTADTSPPTSSSCSATNFRYPSAVAICTEPQVYRDNVILADAYSAAFDGAGRLFVFYEDHKLFTKDASGHPIPCRCPSSRRPRLLLVRLKGRRGRNRWRGKRSRWGWGRWWGRRLTRGGGTGGTRPHRLPARRVRDPVIFAAAAEYEFIASNTTVVFKLGRQPAVGLPRTGLHRVFR
jgi:hypothetical protein